MLDFQAYKLCFFHRLSAIYNECFPTFCGFFHSFFSNSLGFESSFLTNLYHIYVHVWHAWPSSPYFLLFQRFFSSLEIDIKRFHLCSLDLFFSFRVNDGLGLSYFINLFYYSMICFYPIYMNSHYFCFS